jgi:hypothetical protein
MQQNADRILERRGLTPWELEEGDHVRVQERGPESTKPSAEPTWSKEVYHVRRSRRDGRVELREKPRESCSRQTKSNPCLTSSILLTVLTGISTILPGPLVPPRRPSHGHGLLSRKGSHEKGERPESGRWRS